MPEVVVIDPELSVYGPVEEITVSVDIGQTGIRGSKQFVGTGLPGPLTVLETPLQNDLYLNVLNSYLYQYIDSTWTLVGKFAPTTYNVVEGVTFASGNANFTYDIFDMFGITETTGGFIVQYSIIGAPGALATTITQPILTSTDLEFDIEAKYFDLSAPEFWTDLSGNYDVMFSISIGEDNSNGVS